MNKLNRPVRITMPAAVAYNLDAFQIRLTDIAAQPGQFEIEIALLATTLPSNPILKGVNPVRFRIR